MIKVLLHVILSFCSFTYLNIFLSYLQKNDHYSHILKTTRFSTTYFLYLRILTGKKHPQIKLQRFWKAWIWRFGWLLPQSSLYKVFKLKQNFWKDKIVTGKTPFFVMGQFSNLHSFCLNIGFWQRSFLWKCCVFNLSTFK